MLVAAGFSGRGFKHSVALGEGLAALALDATPPVDLSLLDPARYAGPT